MSMIPPRPPRRGMAEPLAIALEMHMKSAKEQDELVAALRARLERAEGLLRKLTGVASGWNRHSAHCTCAGCDTVDEARAFLAPTPPEPPLAAAVPLKEPTCGTCKHPVHLNACPNPYRSYDGRVIIEGWLCGCPERGPDVPRTPEVTR